MQQQTITREELEQFQRDNPNASLAEYINKRNAEIKKKLGMADSRKPQPGRMSFYDLPRSFQDLADVKLEDQAPAEEHSQDLEPSAASSAGGGGSCFASLADKEL